MLTMSSDRDHGIDVSGLWQLKTSCKGGETKSQLHGVREHVEMEKETGY
jgi:hypothetical protein